MLEVSSIFITIAESLSMPAISSRPSPRNFQQSLVGLGIVAALSNQPELRAPHIVVSPRSSSIPILSATGSGIEKVRTAAVDDEMAEESESYTCVISRHGVAEETKWEYFSTPWLARKTQSSPAPVSKQEFLSSCCLCNKNLHGLDIFMYRGEKAFCSAECRYQQMLSDEMKESCAPEALKESSSSTNCPAPRLFLSGVVAA